MKIIVQKIRMIGAVMVCAVAGGIAVCLLVATAAMIVLRTAVTNMLPITRMPPHARTRTGQMTMKNAIDVEYEDIAPTN
ncbi:hypothetical protein [Thalassospira mesophila]|nr:hypothetical protein [Thalassospira mesophila]